MAATQSGALLLLALLCVTATSSVSGLVVNGTVVAAVEVYGNLYCSATGNLAPGAFGLAGVNVSLVCNGSSTDLASTVTGTTGIYVLVLISDGTALDPSACNVTVKLPVATCAVLPSNGTLTAPFTFLNLVLSPIGLLANFVTGSWTHSNLTLSVN